MTDIKVAYFSAEIGLFNDIKTYSGGLGILAGDTIKAMADLEVPFCAITLIYRNGFLKQKIEDNTQTEIDDTWDYHKILDDTGKFCEVNIKGEIVKIKILKYEYEGVTGHKVPIYFLDTNLDENSEWAKHICDKLYRGDRMAQEIVLGIGGIRAIESLGLYNNIKKFHMNEGHSAFLTLEIYKKFGLSIGWDDGLVKSKCIFTTHTPIPAGHDIFEYNDVFEYLKGEEQIIPLHIKKLAGEDKLNMTLLAMNFSNYINGVSRKHREVTEEMFPNNTISYITNGIHTTTWTSKYISELYDKHIDGWREDFTKLKEVYNISDKDLREAHSKSRVDLIKFVNKNNVVKTKLKEDILTIGFARRFIEYKDAELIFKNKNNLRRLGKKVQFIFAGKTHANDVLGKEIMRRIIENAEELKNDVQIAFLENYDIEIAKLLVSGCDLWLNTPIPPNEASGTSGMKAAANGCLHFSRLDGWAIESYEMNGGGFPIAEYSDFIKDLEYQIIPMFYDKTHNIWAQEMKLAIGNSASYFNTHRMAKEYLKVYKI